MIKIITIGKLKEKYLKDAIADYKKRISKYHKIELIELPDTNTTKEKEENKKTHFFQRIHSNYGNRRQRIIQP